MLPASLRKAAVLVQALDEAAADALLEQMGAEQAAQVRSALMELDDIDADEQRQIVAEFLGRQGGLSPAAGQAAGGGVELELSTAGQSLASEERPVATMPAAALHGTSTAPPFAFLLRIPAAGLAREIAREQPQTVAAVLAHLPPERAAAVLELLPTRLATDSLERMATIDRLAPEVLADLAAELQARLAPQLVAEQASANSLAHLSSVLAAMDRRQRERVVTQLSNRNTALADRLGLCERAAPREHDGNTTALLRYRIDSMPGAASPAVSRPGRPAKAPPHAEIDFDDLADLDDGSLRAVLAAAEPELALLALTGAPQRLVERVLRKLTAQEGAALRRRLDRPGPVRLREIDAAQQALAAIAARLVEAGQIVPPRRARFAAAV